MHKNLSGRDGRARECSPHRSQEQVEILKELATMVAARTTRGRPGRASVPVEQCMTQFRLYGDFKMTLQEANRVANLNGMDDSNRSDDRISASRSSI